MENYKKKIWNNNDLLGRDDSIGWNPHESAKIRTFEIHIGIQR